MGIRIAQYHQGRPGRIPHVECLIGTLRRDCLDHVLILGEQHLRQILTLYSRYYNEARTHLSLEEGYAATKALFELDHHCHTDPIRIE